MACLVSPRPAPRRWSAEEPIRSRDEARLVAQRVAGTSAPGTTSASHVLTRHSPCCQGWRGARRLEFLSGHAHELGYLLWTRQRLFGHDADSWGVDLLVDNAGL